MDPGLDLQLHRDTRGASRPTATTCTSSNGTRPTSAPCCAATATIPSVVLYSIGNEIPNQLDDDGWKIAKALVAICHEEDPTRPATSACDQSFVSSRNGFMDALDLAGYNYIDRIYGEQHLRPGARAVSPPPVPGHRDQQPAAPNWLGVRDNDFVIGEFIWTGIDYLGESHASPREARAPASSTSPAAKARVLPARRLLARRPRPRAQRPNRREARPSTGGPRSSS